MYIKIYFNDKPLFLCNEMTPEIAAYAHHDDAVLIDEFSHPAVNSMIHEMRLAKIHAGIFIHKDLDELRKAVFKKFVLVKAGGGLVKNKARGISVHAAPGRLGPAEGQTGSRERRSSIVRCARWVRRRGCGM